MAACEAGSARCRWASRGCAVVQRNLVERGGAPPNKNKRLAGGSFEDFVNLIVSHLGRPRGWHRNFTIGGGPRTHALHHWCGPSIHSSFILNQLYHWLWTTHGENLVVLVSDGPVGGTEFGCCLELPCGRHGLSLLFCMAVWAALNMVIINSDGLVGGTSFGYY